MLIMIKFHSENFINWVSKNFYNLGYFEIVKTLFFIKTREINSANLVFHYFNLYS